jgi:type I restriction enzyme, S subunit
MSKNKVKLADIISEWSEGGTPSSSKREYYDGGTIPWLVIDDVKTKINNSKTKITELGLKNASTKLFPVGSVILSTAATIGRTGILYTEACVKQGIIGIVPNSTLANNVWLKYFLDSRVPELKQLAQGSTIKDVRIPTLSKIELDLPPLHEQQKIAALFSKLDKRIELREQKISNLKEYKKGLQQAVFGNNGERTLRFKDKNGNDYPEWVFNKLVEEAKLYQPQTIQQKDFTVEGYTVFGANGIIGKYKKYNHELPQIAIACRGNTCGTINYTTPFSWITGNAMVVNVDENKNINKEYILHYLSNMNFNEFISGSGQPQITRTALASLEVPIPCMEEQEKIANLFLKIDNQIELEEALLQAAKDEKQGLMQRVF